MGVACLTFVFVFAGSNLGSTITVIHYCAVVVYLWLLFWPAAAKAEPAGREAQAARQAWRPRGYFLVAFYVWLYMGFIVPGDDALVGWPVPPAVWPIAGLTVVIASFLVASWRPGRRPRGRLDGDALLFELISSSMRAVGLVAVYAAIVIDAAVAGAPRPSVSECLTVIGLAFLGCALGSIAAAIAADPSDRLVNAMAGSVRKPVRATLVELGIIAIVALLLVQGGVGGNSVGLFSTAFIAQFALRAMAFRAASSPPETVAATTP
jgi:Ca2+/Na+ antiporter